jgi:hypothetical protein
MNEAIRAGELTQVAVIERWEWWRKALKNPKAIGTAELPVHPNEYQVGYYRTRRKGGPWEPVGIYPGEDGTVIGVRNGNEVQDIQDLFQWACRNPVEYDAYVKAANGGGWEDDVAAIAPAPIGDNSGSVDPADALKDQIDAALKASEAFAKISDDETLSKAQSIRARLNELSRDADKKRDELKRPHLEAGKAIDAAWQPMVKAAKSGADKVKGAMEAFETEKLRRQREEARRAEEARLAAELAAREQDNPAMILEAPKVEPAPVEAMGQIKGAYGKAASVSVKVEVGEVTDWSALVGYMINHPELRDLLVKLANRALDAGRTDIPGIMTIEKAKVR